MKSLNLSKFKKVSSDKKSTTLQHPDGHTIKIAHSVLHPEMRQELDRLPIHKASGGMVKQYAEGSQDGPVSSDDQPQQQNSPVVINVGAQPQQAVATPPQPIPQAPAPQPIQPVAAPTPNQEPLDIQPAPEMDKSSLAPQGNSTPASEQAQPQQSSPDDSMQTDANGAPVDQGQSVPAEQGNYQKSYQDYVQEHTRDFAEQDAAFQHDLNSQHITPETYSDLFAKKSTLGKIGMLFGMLASGAGSGLSHQPNALLQMMNNEIQNDLEAQKQSKSNAQNWIRLNQQHQLNQAQIGLTGAQAGLTTTEANIKSTAFAQMQMNRAALDNIASKVNTLPPGPERAKQEQALALMYTAVNNDNFNIAGRAASAAAYYNTLTNRGKSGETQGDEQAFQQKTTGMRMLGSQGQEMAKNLEEKHFPGLKGQASIPLSSEDRNSIESSIEFDQKLNRFIEWTKAHSGDLKPTDVNAGRALAAELQGAYRQATHGGVYKEGEQNFISKLIDQDPTKFFNSVRVLPQLNAISNETNSRLNQLVKSKGFQGYERPATQSKESRPIEGTTGTFGGKPVVFQNGKWNYK